MSKLWEQVTDNIDERFTNEAAEYFAKHSEVDYIQESATSYDGKALSLKSDENEKKSGKGRVIAIVCAAAAAVMLCVLGGIHLMKNANPLLPTDTSTSEASDTLETGETKDAEYSEISSVETTIELINVINRDDIIAQAGFDIPIDMEKLGDDYQAAIDYVNAMPDGDDKQRYIDQNYFIASMFQSCYVGSDTADWICTISYDFCNSDGFTVRFYSRVFYVKNGHITETVFEADRDSNLKREGRYIYIEKGSDGLFILDTDTMAIKAITADPSNYIYSNDDCTVFRNAKSGEFCVYIHDSGEIIPTDITYGVGYGNTHTFLGDRIRYHDEEADKIYELMLPSCEKQLVDVELEDAFPPRELYDNEFYDINVSEDNKRITITDRQSGSTDELRITEIIGEYGYGGYISANFIRLHEHTLYIPISKNNYDVAVYVKYDIPTKRAVYAYFGGVYGTRMDGEHFIASMIETDEVTGNSSYSYGKVVWSSTSEEQTDEWATVSLYRGGDVEAVLFANALSDKVKKMNQSVYDEYLDLLGEENLTDDILTTIEMNQYNVSSYYVEANDGAEFWLKRYMQNGGINFAFNEIYLRKDGEFRLIKTVDWLDVEYLGETLVRCSGDNLYYSHDDGIVERISTNGEIERVFDVKQYALEDLPEPLETISLTGEGTSMRGGGNVLELTYRYVHNSRELDFSAFRESRIQIDTDNKVIKQEQSAVGISIVDGEGVPFEITTRKHDHDPKHMLADDLMNLGREKLSDAIKLYQIKAREGISSDLESYEDIKTLFDDTFAGDMYNYADHYYASDEPVSAPWYDDNDRLKESLWSSIDSKIDNNGELVHNGYDIADECWTMLYGVIDNGVDFVEYELCTIRRNTSNSIKDKPYYFEHSVMRLEKIDGKWKIAQIRTRLGNEYGTEQRDKLVELGYDELLDEDRSYTEIMCKLLENDGYKVLGTSAEDFDYDGIDELFVLVEKNGSKIIRVYEQQNYGWEFTDMISDESINILNAAQFIKYENYEYRTYNAMGDNRQMLSIRFVPNDNEFDMNRGEYVVEELGTLLYNTPIEYPGVFHAMYERYPDSEPIYYEFADTLVCKWIAALSDGNKENERTFNIINWDVQDIKVTPIDKAPSNYNVTDEERALENAWIVEPEVWYTYEGTVNGREGSPDDWYESIGAENIGFLMWQEGDTFFLRSRWLNGGTKKFMTEDELQQFLGEKLQPAITFAELIYFSGDDAKAAGMKQVSDGLYEVTPDFPYSSIETLKTVAAEYYTEEGVEQLDIDSWFTVVDGKLCARTFNKGLSCLGYTAENAEILSQYLFYLDRKVVIKLKMTDWLTRDQYSGDGYGVVMLIYDYNKGKWLFEKPII